MTKKYKILIMNIKISKSKITVLGRENEYYNRTYTQLIIDVT